MPRWRASETPVGRLEVDDRRRAAAEERPLVMRGQEPGPPAGRAPFGRSLGLGHHDIGRQVVALGAQAVGDPAPQAGETHHDPARRHLIHGRRVDHAIGIARSNQRDIVGVGVQVRHEVRHVHSRLPILAPLAVAAQAERVGFEKLAVDLAEARRQRLRVEPVQERLGVEQVHLARAAGHEQKNAALGLGRQVARPGSQRTGGRRGPCVACQQIGQPEQAEPAAGDLEELAPAARSERLRAGTAAGQGRLGHSQVP